ncbi:permease [Natronospora cellulosivora (SeqCode)]
MKKNKNNKRNYIIFTVFISLILVSYLSNFSFGKKVGENFWIFAIDMIKILPPAFLLIGLFDVWVSKETIQRSFGKSSGFKKYIYSILLAATTVGGTFVAFPVANSLYHKGANYSSIFTYITSASILMIPMTIMEASILGLRFTIIRVGVSIPLVIISSILLNNYFTKNNYQLPVAK